MYRYFIERHTYTRERSYMNQFGYSATQVANILKHLSAIIFFCSVIFTPLLLLALSQCHSVSMCVFFWFLLSPRYIIPIFIACLSISSLTRAIRIHIQIYPLGNHRNHIKKQRTNIQNGSKCGNRSFLYFPS